MPSKKLPTPPAAFPGNETTANHDPSAAEERAARLRRLKSAIDNGTYRIPAENIAEKMVGVLEKKVTGL